VEAGKLAKRNGDRGGCENIVRIISGISDF